MQSGSIADDVPAVVLDVKRYRSRSGAEYRTWLRLAAVVCGHPDGWSGDECVVDSAICRTASGNVFHCLRGCSRQADDPGIVTKKR